MPLKEEELKEEQKEAATSGRGAVVSRGETNYRGEEAALVGMKLHGGVDGKRVGERKCERSQS